MDTEYNTPTPWVYKYGAIYQEDTDGTNTEKRLLLADRTEEFTRPVERDANLRRVVACVNACHGIGDPDRAHAVARDAIREAHDLLDRLECYFSLEVYEADWLDAAMRVYIARRLDHLSEAHALLGGGPL